MLLNFWLFDDSVIEIVTVTFSSLILIELLNINTSLHGRITLVIFMSQLITAIIYIASVIIFKDYINVDSILRLEFLRKVGTIVLAAWGPMWLMRIIRKKMDPTEG